MRSALQFIGKMLFPAMTVLAVLAAAPSAWSQQYPTKPVRIVAPFAPGGGTDFIARLIAQKLTAALGQQFVVDNRPGAGGTLGTEIGVKSAPDGYTLTMIAASYTVNPSLYKLKFDPANDISAVILIDKGPFLVVVHPSMPVKNIKDLIALAKAKPGEINYATSGQGSIVHMATELFLNMAGIKMTHIPYKGTGPALTDTISGQTTLLFGSIASTLPYTKSGRLRPIAVTTAKRIPAEPGIPSIAESGVPGYDVTNWHGLIGPKGMPRSIVDRVNSEVAKIIKQKDMEKQLQGDGLSADGGPAEEFQQRIRREIDQWKRVVAQSGIKLN
ncbi:MAG TPA: tripartite tricarboxylate transporter substrate binding protein [Burkholderiales bacterium]|nr:tripartite tricarboxylate transporter substrate binding protein [Burkholderiales bacterium]